MTPGSCLPICFFALLLFGCSPSAKQIADQKARQSFREAIAAMKVCTQGATYQEFRQKRSALETSCIANRSALAGESRQIDQLEQVMKATDTLWEWQIKFPHLELLPSGKGSGWIEAGWAEDPWEAMLVINPAVAVKAGFTEEQCRKDPDFYAKNYVRRGLTLIASQCDNLLK